MQVQWVMLCPKLDYLYTKQTREEFSEACLLYHSPTCERLVCEGGWPEACNRSLKATKCLWWLTWLRSTEQSKPLLVGGGERLLKPGLVQFRPPRMQSQERKVFWWLTWLRSIAKPWTLFIYLFFCWWGGGTTELWDYSGLQEWEYRLKK